MSVPHGATVAVFGASPFGAECLLACEAAGVTVAMFIDNSTRRQGTRFLGRTVVAPGALLSAVDPVDAVIIASEAHGPAMRRQLIELGIGHGVLDYFAGQRPSRGRSAR